MPAGSTRTASPGVNDHDYVTAQIAPPSVVTIKATAPFASEDGPQAGTLTIERTQKLLPITVSYTTGGTALPGTAYATLLGSVVLGAGVGSAGVDVNPAQSASVKGSRSVTVTLTPTTMYDIGAPSSATVIIHDSTVASGTGLLAGITTTRIRPTPTQRTLGTPGITFTTAATRRRRGPSWSRPRAAVSRVSGLVIW